MSYNLTEIINALHQLDQSLAPTETTSPIQYGVYILIGGLATIAAAYKAYQNLHAKGSKDKEAPVTVHSNAHCISACCGKTLLGTVDEVAETLAKVLPDGAPKEVAVLVDAACDELTANSEEKASPDTK